MFYFIHQIKLETIPYVEKQIISFINYFQQHLQTKNLSQFNHQTQDQEWIAITHKLLKIMRKKYQQIENFYDNNWMDYRASLILRSKSLITLFFEKHSQTLLEIDNLYQQQISYQQNTIKIEKINTQNLPQTSEFNENSIQVQKTDNKKIDFNIKQSVKRIKTQMALKSHKTVDQTSKISIKQTKKSVKNNLKVSKVQITNQVNKIIQKQKVKQKLSNSSLLFSSRRKQQSKIQNKMKQKAAPKILVQQKDKKNLQNQLKKSIQKMVSKSKSKSKLTTKNKLKQRVNLSKEEQVILTKSKQKEKQVPAKAKLVRNKKMTKQEYVEYLMNKNKQQNRNSF